jgi:hypothetical protein
MNKEGKKYKKIAKGEISINKNIFIDDKIQVEKCITLTLYKSVIEKINSNQEILQSDLQSGKIFMNITLLDPIEQWKKSAFNKNQNKSDKNNISEYQKKLKQKNKQSYEDLNEETEDNLQKEQFDDGLSDLSISIVDEEEEDRKGLDLEQFINDKYIKHLKELISSDYENILPKDYDKLKEMNEMLYNKFTELSNSYNEAIFSLNKSNEEIRQKAKKYYEEYKKLKNDLYKERLNYKQKNLQLKNEIEANNEDNKNLINEIENLNSETKMLKEKLSISNEQREIPKSDNADIEILTDVLKKLQNLGYDIFTGSGLSEDEKNKVKNLICNSNDLNQNNLSSEEDMRDDIELGNQIVSLIERDVNELYLKKWIENVKIDQVNAITYSFQDEVKTKEITLRIENGNLMCMSGGTFNSWLITNFGA